MREFFIKMLSEEKKTSSKRVVTFAAFILMATGFLVELFTDFSVSENTFNAVEYIIIAGLGFTASEKFVNFKQVTKKEEKNDLLQG
jgi:membrane protein CcdC involved in cytochrome C biogenesis